MKNNPDIRRRQRGLATFILLVLFNILPAPAQLSLPDETPDPQAQALTQFRKGDVPSEFVRFKFQLSTHDLLLNCMPQDEAQQDRIKTALEQALHREDAGQQTLLALFVEEHQHLYGEQQMGVSFEGWNGITAQNSDAEVTAALQQQLDAAILSNKKTIATRLLTFGDQLPFFLIKDNAGKNDIFDVFTSRVTFLPKVYEMIQAEGKLQIWEVYPEKEIPQPLIETLNAYTTQDISLAGYRGILTHIFKENIKITKSALKRNQDLIPDDMNLAWGGQEDFYHIIHNRYATFGYGLFALKSKGGHAAIEGDVVQEMQLQKMNGQPVINFQLTPQAATDFARITEQNLRKPIVITIDNQVLSAPMVQSKITSGNCQIASYLTTDTAPYYENILRCGTLRIPLKTLRINVVNKVEK